ncbi:hypothetical protein Landi51_08090 [Colletotrichum acutatum]
MSVMGSFSLSVGTAFTLTAQSERYVKDLANLETQKPLNPGPDLDPAAGRQRALFPPPTPRYGREGRAVASCMMHAPNPRELFALPPFFLPAPPRVPRSPGTGSVVLSGEYEGPGFPSYESDIGTWEETTKKVLTAYKKMGDFLCRTWHLMADCMCSSYGRRRTDNTVPFEASPTRNR